MEWNGGALDVIPAWWVWWNEGRNISITDGGWLCTWLGDMPPGDHETKQASSTVITGRYTYRGKFNQEVVDSHVQTSLPNLTQAQSKRPIFPYHCPLQSLPNPPNQSTTPHFDPDTRHTGTETPLHAASAADTLSVDRTQSPLSRGRFPSAGTSEPAVQATGRRQTICGRC